MQWNQAAERAAKQAAIVSKQESVETERDVGTSDQQHVGQTEVEAASEHQPDTQSSDAAASGGEEGLSSSAAIAQSIQADPIAARASHSSEAGELSIDLGQDTSPRPRAVNVKVRLRVEEPAAPRDTHSKAVGGALDVASSEEAERKVAAYWDSVQSREKEASAAKRSEILSVSSTPTSEHQHPGVAEA